MPSSLACVGATSTGVEVLPESRVAGCRRPHHDRLRRTAFLRRLQRRAQDGRARPGRPRDGDDAARRPAHRASQRHLGRHRGQPDPRRRPRDRADGAGRTSRSTSRSIAISRSRPRSPATCSPSIARACAHAKDTAMRAGARAVRRRADDQLRLSARSEPVSGGEGDVGRREDRQARRHDHLRGGMPRRPAESTAATARCSRRSPTREALLAMINAPGYSAPDQWQVQVQAQIQTKADVLVKTSGLGPTRCAPRTSRRSTMWQRAVRDACDAPARGATLCVLPQGPQTIPYVRLRPGPSRMVLVDHESQSMTDAASPHTSHARHRPTRYRVQARARTLRLDDGGGRLDDRLGHLPRLRRDGTADRQSRAPARRPGSSPACSRWPPRSRTASWPR